MKGGESCGGLKRAQSPTLILRPSYKEKNFENYKMNIYIYMNNNGIESKNDE